METPVDKHGDKFVETGYHSAHSQQRTTSSRVFKEQMKGFQ